MDELEFEKSLKEAFVRLERKDLKQRLIDIDSNAFESDIQDAFLLNERTILKKRLTEIKETTQPKMTWWKYSAAACVLFVVGLFFYQNSTHQKLDVAINKPKIKKVEQNSSKLEEIAAKKQKENVTVINAKPNNSEKTVTKDQVYKSKVFVEEIGQLGFGTKQLDLKILVNPTNSKFEYRFIQNNLEIKLPKKLNVKLYKLQDQFYIKISQKVFFLSKNKEFEEFNVVVEQEILNLLP